MKENVLKRGRFIRASQDGFTATEVAIGIVALVVVVLVLDFAWTTIKSSEKKGGYVAPNEQNIQDLQKQGVLDDPGAPAQPNAKPGGQGSGGGGGGGTGGKGAVPAPANNVQAPPAGGGDGPKVAAQPQPSYAQPAGSGSGPMAPSQTPRQPSIGGIPLDAGQAPLGAALPPNSSGSGGTQGGIGGSSQSPPASPSASPSASPEPAASSEPSATPGPSASPEPSASPGPHSAPGGVHCNMAPGGSAPPASC